ncbi:MAG: AMP-binding protein [Gammaproteobacteria bacterium]|nr:AMP-binding protein [Gammaproteobacteria bacterium]
MQAWGLLTGPSWYQADSAPGCHRHAAHRRAELNLYQRILDAAAGREAAVAVSTPGRGEWTHGDLHAGVERCAGVLQAAGVQPGDRVTVQVEKSFENLQLYLAVLRIGAVYMPLNTAYTEAELEYFIGDAEPRVLICDPQRQASLARLGEKMGLGAVLTLGADGRGSLTDAMAGSLGSADVCPRQPDDLAAIVYTSGTTGRSKGAMLSHGNLFANAATLRQIWGWRPDDVLLHALPIYHVHGLFVALHCALLEPSPILLLPRFDVDAVLDVLPEATVLMGVPTFYVRLLSDPRFDRDRCAGMRLFISGSAPLLPETFDAFEERTGMRILERYGMTEAGMITSNPLNGERVAGTVGFPLPDVEVRLRGTEGEAIAEGGVGVLEIRGPNVFGGYWRQPERTAAEFRDGWFITGDLAERASDGRISIVGRHKDLIISGGLNIYPREIEAELNALPGIEESAVIGVPHTDFGEAVMALVVAADAWAGEAAVIASLKQRLAGFKVPRKVLRVESLPRNAMGKVQKNLLREAHLATFAD